jgi:hypothetical protein
MSGVHFIDGQYYVEVERDAKIDDYITKDGILRTVTGINEEWDSVEFYDYVSEEGDRICGWGNGDYKTLEPLSTVDSSQASEQVIEMFTALSRKIVSLERQLADTQRNVETWAEQTENVKQHTYEIERDVIDLEKRLDNGKSPKEYLIDTTESVTVPKWLLLALSKNIEGGAR